MNNRRGFAMIAALWLMIGIAVVTLQFTLVGKERFAMGFAAAERGKGRAETLGGVALLQATLDNALLVAQTNGAGLQAFRAFDIMLGADSAFGGPIELDSNTTIEVHIDDLGAQLNINTATEAQLRSFFSWILGDAQAGQNLSQAMIDWRDIDDNRLTTGAETEDYLKDGALALPTNTPFRVVDDIRDVMGMTPEIYDLVSPYLTTFGTQLINLNTAPEEVLHAIPSISDDVVANIINARSQGARIQTQAAVMPASVAATVAAITAATTVTSNQFVVSVTSRPYGERAVKLRALLTRAGTTTTIGWKQW